MLKGENPTPSKNSSGYLSRYLDYTAGILTKYNRNQPFHIYLKKYFTSNKKHGSKDRKIITSLCYNYFRTGFGVIPELDWRQKLLLSIFLCETRPSAFLAVFKPEWDFSIHLPIHKKIKIVDGEFDLNILFPFKDELSYEIDSGKYNLSFLVQPKFFIRVRPGCSDSIINKLKEARLSFDHPEANCLSFSNNEKVTDIIQTDKEAVIQDFNSIKTLDCIKDLFNEKDKINCWDCCAGSGGKSILAYDILKNINLTVSDKRDSILNNLKNRFSKAGITNYKMLLTDLEKPAVGINASFDLIIADVPCSGSGTWARTPEQILFFHKNEVKNYASIQRKIIDNVLPYLNANGYLLYITCSIFKMENEENVDIFQEKYGLKLIQQEYLIGYEMQADSLFIALFKKEQ